MKRPAFISASLIAALLSVFYFWGYPVQEKELLLKEKKPESIEMKLFQLVNKARKKHGLTPVQLSPALTHLARLHSQDMARRGRISHESSSGESYRDRLVNAGFTFASIGENVAYSTTFLAEPIHQGLMDSPGHRKNILGSDFDEVGIGVVVKGNEYFVTQDFRRALPLRDVDEVKEEIKKELNALRGKKGFAALTFGKDADEFASKYSINRSKHQSNLPPPSNFGDHQIFYVASPTLEGYLSVYKKEIMKEIYEKAGIGVSFGKTKEYPGGCYFITLILFPENIYKNLSDNELKQLVYVSLIKTRRSKGGPLLIWDVVLAESAELALKHVIEGKDLSSFQPPRPAKISILYYVTKDPNTLPKGVTKKMEEEFRDYTKIGIAIRFIKNQDHPSGAFRVSVLIEE